MRRSKTHDVMNYYVARVNKDSSSVVKNLMKLTTRGNTGKTQPCRDPETDWGEETNMV